MTSMSVILTCCYCCCLQHSTTLAVHSAAQRSAAQRSTAQHSTDKEVVLAFMAHLRTKSDASVPYLLKDLR